MGFMLLHLLSYLAICSAAVTRHSRSSLEVHETRAPHEHWTKLARSRPDTLVSFSIGLTQQNLGRGDAWLYEVADPASPKYGQHWSADQLVAAFSPSNETVMSVYHWLSSSKVANDITMSASRTWIRFKATVGDAESLLDTKYSYYEHSVSKKLDFGCDAYSLPAHLRKHIDFVTPGVNLHNPVKLGKRRPLEDEHITPIDPLPPAQTVPTGTKPNVEVAMNPSDVPTAIEAAAASCPTRFVPGCYQFLYGIPVNFQASPSNSFAVAEFIDQSWNQSDLSLYFQAQMPRVPTGLQPTVDGVDGGYDFKVTNIDNEFETMLDLTIAYSTTWPQPIKIFEVGTATEFASNNNWLDAMDASYCTYDGGDNPNYDYIYPDSSYPYPEMCGTYSPPNVISVSYEYPEWGLSPAYEARQCYEYMKLGLAGVSIIFSSGDDGVAGSNNYCGRGNCHNCGRFVPGFPSSCPYVTSVGSTQLKPGTNIVTDAQNGVKQSEVATYSFYSGGGFSDNFALPQYQASAVGTWWNTTTVTYTSSQFNNSQQSRGIPDVAAGGWDYIHPIDGLWYLDGGTSASAPLIGGILTLINENRLNAGKSSIGFANPAFYANPSMFNDVTVGNNAGCGTNGFYATAGWDPLTGLGTPIYPAMLAYFMSLP